MELSAVPISMLKGVGSKLAEKLTHLRLHTVQDLLFHLPLRYEDRTRLYPIAELSADHSCTTEGVIQSCDIQMGKRRMLLCRISDGNGSVTLRFFHFTAGQKNALAVGRRIRCFGEIKRGLHGFEIVHPEYKLLDDDAPLDTDTTLTAVYPTTEGLRQASLRNLTDQALQLLKENGVKELLPDGLYPRQLSLADALLLLHRPPPDISLAQLENGQHPAQQRLALEELIAHHLTVLQLRYSTQQHQARALPTDCSLCEQLLARLPFKPTGAQQRVGQEISHDLT